MSTIELVALSQGELSPGFQIQRALPQRALRRIGAWAFLDHIGPVQLSEQTQLKVRSHPHIGLQTFTWMISGQIAHADSLGYEQTISPGQINLMTSGDGIAHTETSIGTSGRLHAAQLWIALPENATHIPASFENYPNLPIIEQAQATYTVLVGTWENATSPVKVHTPLMANDIVIQQSHQTQLALNPEFEYGFLPMEGNITINGHVCDGGHLVYVGTGHEHVDVAFEAGSRILMVGGEPLQEQLIVWWNLIARTQTQIEQAREDWQQQSPRYGNLPPLGEWLEAPEITGALKANGPKSHS